MGLAAIVALFISLIFILLLPYLLYQSIKEDMEWVSKGYYARGQNVPYVQQYAVMRKEIAAYGPAQAPRPPVPQAAQPPANLPVQQSIQQQSSNQQPLGVAQSTQQTPQIQQLPSQEQEKSIVKTSAPQQSQQIPFNRPLSYEEFLKLKQQIASQPKQESNLSNLPRAGAPLKLPTPPQPPQGVNMAQPNKQQKISGQSPQHMASVPYGPLYAIPPTGGPQKQRMAPAPAPVKPKIIVKRKVIYVPDKEEERRYKPRRRKI